MATLTVTLPTGTTVVNGKQVTFRAPCDCTGISGIVINGTTYTLVDATTEQITGHTFKKDAMVSVIMDTENNKAFVQNGIIFGVSTVELTREEYDALVAAGEIDQNTIYVVTDDSTSVGGAQFIINTDEGVTVTATDGVTTVGRNGPGILHIPGYGTWTVTATSGTVSKSEIVIVDTLKQYEVAIKFYDSNFESNTWAQIIEACQLNVVPNTWVVGRSKTMLVDGDEVIINIIGKNHDTYEDGTVAPLTFQFDDCVGTAASMYPTADNSIGWDGSSIRSSRMSRVLSNMPEEVRTNVREVAKITNSGDSTALETTYDKLFLLSEIECLGSALNSYSGEGKQYAYYSSGNSKVKQLNGKDAKWFLRSPYENDDMSFCAVDTDGTRETLLASTSAGVCPAFCF